MSELYISCETTFLLRDRSLTSWVKWDETPLMQGLSHMSHLFIKFKPSIYISLTLISASDQLMLNKMLLNLELCLWLHLCNWHSAASKDYSMNSITDILRTTTYLISKWGQFFSGYPGFESCVHHLFPPVWASLRVCGLFFGSRPRLWCLDILNY